MAAGHQILMLTFLATVASTLSTPRSLQARYVDPNEFPAQCQTQCASIIDALNTCTITSCICTNANSETIEQCGDCVLQAIPTPAEVIKVQYVFNYYTGFCIGAGAAVIPPSIAVVASSTTLAVAATAPAGSKSLTLAPSMAATAGTSSTNPFQKNSERKTGPNVMIVLAGVACIVALNI